MLHQMPIKCPSKDVVRELLVPDQTRGARNIRMKYAMMLVGGDQLTVVRIRGAQNVRDNSETSNCSNMQLK